MNTQLSRRRFKKSPLRIKGQGLTEYIIIVALVAIAAISAASYFGDSVKASFRSMSAKLTGAPAVDMVAETKNAADKSKADTEGLTTLQNYGN